MFKTSLLFIKGTNFCLEKLHQIISASRKEHNLEHWIIGEQQYKIADTIKYRKVQNSIHLNTNQSLSHQPQKKLISKIGLFSFLSGNILGDEIKHNLYHPKSMKDASWRYSMYPCNRGLKYRVTKMWGQTSCYSIIFKNGEIIIGPNKRIFRRLKFEIYIYTASDILVYILQICIFCDMSDDRRITEGATDGMD